MKRGESSRQKILKAARELVISEGAAHISLDAIAARAGLSKGGLLYNFPNKTALMRALVQEHIDELRAELDGPDCETGGVSLATRYRSAVISEMERNAPPPSGLWAALAEDPCLLEPVKTFNRELLTRMMQGADDPGAVLTLFLVLEGLRAQFLLGTGMLTDEEKHLLMDKVAALVGAV